MNSDLFNGTTAISQSICVAVAHPEDGVAGMGAQLFRLEDVHLVHVTNGAPRDPWYWRRTHSQTAQEHARKRFDELKMALSLAGISTNRSETLDVHEQEAALHLVELTRRLAARIEALRPEIILTHSCEGGHPDHDAVAFCVWAAAHFSEHKPLVIEMAGYHEAGGRLVTGRFLKSCDAIVHHLDEEAQNRKLNLLRCFRSQPLLLDQFALSRECFRIASAPALVPLSGRRPYESWCSWMSAERFSRLTEEASQRLGLSREGEDCYAGSSTPIADSARYSDSSLSSIGANVAEPI